jgi:hypothetical protein
MMPHAQGLLFTQVLILTWLFSRLLPRRLLWLAVALGLAALLPWHGLSLAQALRAFWGDPSITTMQLLVLGIAGRPPAAFARAWRAPAMIATFSLLFYPLALGAGDFDPYRLGFQPVLLLTALAVPALALWWRGQTLWLWLLAIDLLAFAFGLLESTNFWDYLIDPLLALVCIRLAMRNYAANQRQRKSQSISTDPVIHHE